MINIYFLLKLEKPSCLDSFFKQFIDDMETLLDNGTTIRNKKISISIRCFICDTPARALIKGKHAEVFYCCTKYIL